jgi:hypothetical protein
MTLASLRAVFLCLGFVALYLAWAALSHLRVADSACEVPVVVEVLNGCGVHGLAERVGDYLRNQGFDVIFVGNADDFGYVETLVVDRCGDRSKALAVAEALRRDTVIFQVGGAFFVDVSVVVGSDATQYISADDE